MIGGAGNAATRLETDRRRLERVWEQSADGWDDQVRTTFTIRFWTGLDAETRIYLGGLHDLAALLADARREVS